MLDRWTVVNAEFGRLRPEYAGRTGRPTSGGRRRPPWDGV